MVALVATIASCGLLGGSDDPERSGSGGANGKPEVDRVSVAILNTLEAAPLHYAIEQGYFRDEGLDIKLVNGKSGGDNTAKLIGEDVNIAFSSYSPFFAAQSKGAADIKLIADASATAPGNATVMAKPGTASKLLDLNGKRVGVSALGTMAHLLTQSVAKVAGVDIATIQWVPIPFPQTTQALLSGDIDAAYLTEPYRQEALMNGLMDISDTSTGPTDRMPLTGYGTLDKFAKKNPNAVAIFQRGLVRATLELNTTAYGERERLVKVILPEVSDNVAAMVGWPELTYALDPTPIQRTADLMTEFDEIPHLEVKSMIIRPELPGA